MKKLPMELTHCCKAPFKFKECGCGLVCSKCERPASANKD